jgi:hypothetical protein
MAKKAKGKTTKGKKAKGKKAKAKLTGVRKRRRSPARGPLTARVAAAVAAHPSPIFHEVPGRPDQIERCDWNAAENEYDCQIIDKTEAPATARLMPPRGKAARRRRSS